MKDKLKLSFFLTSRSILRGDKWTLALVAAIMMIVFMNLLFTDAIFYGITEALNKNKIDYQYGEVFIEPAPGEEYVKDYKQIKALLKDDPRVKSIAPTLKIGANFINEKNKDGRDEEEVPAILESWDPDEDTVFDIEKYIVDGRMLDPNASGEIILGSYLAGGYGPSAYPKDLGSVRPGQKIRVDFAGLSREYEIVGIYKTKDFDADMKAFILRRELRPVLGTSRNHATEVVVRLYNKDDAKDIVELLKASGFKKYKIADWEEKIAFGAGISKSFEIIGQLFRVIGAVVAGLVIFIIIFVDIVNKKRQIGILKAIGIKDSVIILDYVTRGVIYTIMGAVLGYFLMLAIIEWFTKHPIEMPMADVVPLLRDNALLLSSIFFIIAGVIGSFIPAVKEIKKKVLVLLYR